MNAAHLRKSGAAAAAAALTEGRAKTKFAGLVARPVAAQAGELDDGKESAFDVAGVGI